MSNSFKLRPTHFFRGTNNFLGGLRPLATLVTGLVDRLKTEVTNQLRKIVRFRIRKAAEHKTAIKINSDKLIDTNS